MTLKQNWYITYILDIVQALVIVLAALPVIIPLYRLLVKVKVRVSDSVVLDFALTFFTVQERKVVICAGRETFYTTLAILADLLINWIIP